MREVQLRQARETAGWARLVKGQLSIPWPSHLPKAEAPAPGYSGAQQLSLSSVPGQQRKPHTSATSLWLHFPAYKLKVYTPAFPVFGPVSGLAVPVN